MPRHSGYFPDRQGFELIFIIGKKVQSLKNQGGSNMFSKAFLDYQDKIPTAPPASIDGRVNLAWRRLPARHRFRRNMPI